MSNLIDRIAMAESGGNINAVSPTPLSSAQGLFGFTDAAFNQVIQDNPDLAHVTKDQWKKDPELQRTFAGRLQKFHEGVLKGQGFEPTPTNIYANWHFGSGGGPKFLKAAPDTRMEDILDPVAIAANPHLQGKTQGQILQWINGKMGGGSMLPNATAQSRGQTNMNPQTDNALALYQQLLGQQQNSQPQFTPEQLQMLTQNRQQRASMLPLAIGASLAGDKRISGMGQALYKDASEAQGPMQLGNEGWLTPDGQMIENPYTKAARQETRQDRLLTLALNAINKGKAPDPYFTPVMTPTGLGAFNNRAGVVTIVNGPDGKPLVDARFDPKLQGDIANSKAIGTGQGNATVKGETDVKNAGTSLQVLDSIENLFKKNPTASGLGSLLDKSMAFFGRSNEGADVAAALKTESNKLLMNVPRFEGPQSDRDTLTYREAAGNLGDETIPLSQRKKAAEQIREIMNRNIQAGTINNGGQGAGKPAPQGAPSIDDLLNKYK